LATYLSALSEKDKRFYFLQVEVSDKEAKLDKINFTDAHRQGDEFFTELMEDLLGSDKALPLRRNKNELYTNKQFAKDIIAYSMLTAYFRKIIPDSYWNNIKLGHFTDLKNNFLMKKHESTGLNLFTLFFMKNNGLKFGLKFVDTEVERLMKEQKEEIEKKQVDEIERITNPKNKKDEKELEDLMKEHGTMDKVKEKIRKKIEEEFEQKNRAKFKDFEAKYLKKEQYQIYKSEELCLAVL